MDLHFAGIDRIIFAPIFILFGLAALKNCLHVVRSVKLITHPLTQKIVFPYFSSRKHVMKTVLILLTLGLLLIAFCQPQWGKKEQAVVQEGRDLLILLDVSRSMLAEDMSPSRLDFAKLKIRNLLDRLPVDRTGLVLFAGSAFLQCPLTSDRAAFLLFLDQVDVHSISSGTTALDAALNKSIEVFKVAAERKNKLVLLITDGEDFSTNLSGVRKKAEDLGITLFVLGVGTKEGAPVPKFDHEGKRIGCETDAAGAIVLTKLNEVLLQETCKQLKGSYLLATHDDTDIKHVAGLVKKFEKERISDKKVSLYEEQYYWFLGLAWILLALEWIL